MNRILLASALVLGISGAAIARDAPYYVGDYDGNVERQLNHDISGSNDASAPSNVDRTTTESIPDANQQTAPANINFDENRSGR